MPVTKKNKLTFMAFLSHRYKAPEINLYFLNLFDKYANLQFEIDVGTSATNVTRLERMIRNADAFIGLYSFSVPATHIAKREELEKASRYFRLELNLALRRHKPIFIFADKRYGNLLHTPEADMLILYDPLEINSESQNPQEKYFIKAIDQFVKYLYATKEAKDAQPVVTPATSIGLVVPKEGRSDSAYSINEINLIKTVAEQNDQPVVELPPGEGELNNTMLRWLSQLDYIITDVGELSMSHGLVPFLHGFGIPMIRLWKGIENYDAVKNQPVFKSLFGATEVGYPTDIVYWKTKEDLKKELDSRFAGIRAPVERISNLSKARKYFNKAIKRNDAVFVSYSGKDEQIAKKIVRELKNSFQEVFDYKDGESITPGQPWLQEIFDKLAKSALGIQLLSDSYTKSGNCMHEARQMVAQQDAGNLSVIPIKLTDEKLDSPSWAQERQYLRLYDYPSINDAIEKIIDSIDRYK